MKRIWLTGGLLVWGWASGAGVLAQAIPAPAATDSLAEAEGPEGIEATLDQRDELADDPTKRSLFPGWYPKFQEWRRSWSEKAGLRVTTTYDVVGQQLVAPDRSFGALGGDLTISGSWVTFGRRTSAPLYLAFRTRYRHAIGGVTPPSQVQERGGLIWNSVDGFSDSGLQLPDFYLTQKLFDERLLLRYGQMTIDNLFDRHSLRGAKRFFLSEAFASNPGVAFPSYGTGIIAQWKSSHHWDLTFGASNVQGTRSDEDVSFSIDSGQLFQAVQLGFDFDGFGGREARAQLLFWRSDELPDQSRPEGEGLAFTYEQQLAGGRGNAFARAAYSNGDPTEADLFFAAGVGREFRTFDYIGFALAAGRSSFDTGLWQASGEVFYRWQVTKELVITPDVQIVVGDGTDGGDPFRVLVGIRGGIQF